MAGAGGHARWPLEPASSATAADGGGVRAAEQGHAEERRRERHRHHRIERHRRRGHGEDDDGRPDAGHRGQPGGPQGDRYDERAREDERDGARRRPRPGAIDANAIDAQVHGVAPGRQLDDEAGAPAAPGPGVQPGRGPLLPQRRLRLGAARADEGNDRDAPPRAAVTATSQSPAPKSLRSRAAPRRPGGGAPAGVEGPEVARDGASGRRRRRSRGQDGPGSPPPARHPTIEASMGSVR
jgi:hypothetical protein